MWHTRGKAEMHTGFLYENLKVKRLLEKKRKLGDKMQPDLHEIRWENVDWVNMAEGTDRLL